MTPSSVVAPAGRQSQGHVMVGVSLRHGPAPEIFLRPALTEPGANRPGRALFDSQEEHRIPGAVSV
ncbi:hypothetical protein [Streptomyces adonidis]|uniref:hypothetical protein n=1 Tax=Streptomyces adonidis TaxID=3231367 RepID=UPI0034DAFAA1